ncbi:aspartyl protease family protein [Paraburkholderia kururiensis]|uniref:aspartyl protease family protein n=1 Tax=Paraburkholderia kururiensis TaxID=984307 RepID=UPI0039A7238A
MLVLPSAPRIQALLAAGMPMPLPVTGTFLIDTGASSTVVDDQFVAPLGLQPTSMVGMHTPSTNGVVQQCNLYDVQIVIAAPNSVPFVINALAVMEASLRPQGIDGLIGRDVLDRTCLIYNGTAQTFSLAF